MTLQKIYGSTKHVKGFSLIETLIAMMTVVSIVLFSFDSLRALWQQQRMRILREDWVTAFYLARSYATGQRGKIVFCVAKQKQCRKDNNWAQGWIIFGDANANTRLDAGERLWSVYKTSLNGYTMRSNNYIVPYRITFDKLGNTTMLATFTITAPDRNTLYVCIGGASRLRYAPKGCRK